MYEPNVGKLVLTQSDWKWHHSTYQFNFLLAFHINYVHIMYYFRDSARYWSKINNFTCPICIWRPSWGDQTGIWPRSSVGKTRVPWLPCDTQRAANGCTNRQNCYISIILCVLIILMCDKNENKINHNMTSNPHQKNVIESSILVLAIIISRSW